MSTIHKGFTVFDELDHSLDEQVKIVEAHEEVVDELLKESKARETKFWEELATS